MENIVEIKSLNLCVKEGKEEKVIFSDINAAACSSQFIALIGANGKGKSTLLKTISGILPNCGGGEILFRNKAIESYGRKERSSLLAFVGANNPRAKNLTVRGVLSINRYYKTNWLGSIKQEDEKRISEALEMVSLAGFEERDSSVLSDGEYQRVTIAGAIAQDTEAIILDEPTAFLDIANRFLITRLLRDIAHKSNKCIIFSTHDLQTAIQMCDKIWVMAGDGFYDDTPEKLMEQDIFNKIFDGQRIVFNRTTRSFEAANETI